MNKKYLLALSISLSMAFSVMGANKFCWPFSSVKKKIVVAHRGASGYLPEHTLEAKAMAHAFDADYIEQDLVLTKDNQVVVLHDIHLDTVTDVAAVYPERYRSDGRYYAIDFTLEEIKKLRVTERIDLETGLAVYPRRFPAFKAEFKVPTFEEEIQLIQGLNKSRNKNVGIYPEIKSPAWHWKEGKDISAIVLNILVKYGYAEQSDKCFLQCFDAEELKRIRIELQCRLKLVQLIGENSWGESDTDYNYLKTPEGIREISTYADGIGPWMDQIVEGRDEWGRLIITDLVRNAHRSGLKVHPYTFRNDSLPDYVKNFNQLLTIFYFRIGVDGVFTDFPDRAVKYLKHSK